MAINKPTKPNVTLPDNFGGIKTAYTESQIQSGYEDGIPQIVDGGNINYEKDAVFQKLKYIEAVADAVANTPPGKYLVVDSNNRFEYADSAVQSTQGNIGDIQYTVATQVPYGGVWCDGSYYSKSNAETLYQMLVDKKLQVVTTAQYETELSQNGQCAKFALDVSNERFRVPTIQDIYIKAGDAVNTSNYESESLPNIKGEQSLNVSENGMSSGTFYNNGRNSNEGIWEDGSKITTAPGSSGNVGERIYFNASRSSSVYKDGANVEVNHINLRAYVVIYTTMQEDVDMSEAIKSNNPFFLGQSMYSPTAPENASWLKSDGTFHSGLVYPSIYEWIIENVKKGTQDFKSDMAYAYSGDGLNVWFPIQNPVVGATAYSTTDGTPVGKVTSVDVNTVIVNGVTLTANGSGSAGSSLFTDYDFRVNASNQTFRLPLLDGSEDLPSSDFKSMPDESNVWKIAPYNAYVSAQITLDNVTSAQWLLIQVTNSNGQVLRETVSKQPNGSGYVAVETFVARGERYKIEHSSSITALKNSNVVKAKGNGSLYYYVGDTTKDADIVNFNNLKLELDECVHKTGDENISGVKTAIDGFVFSGSLDKKDNRTRKGTVPDTTYYSGVQFVDGTDTSVWQEKRFGSIESVVNSNGNVQLNMAAYKNERGSSAASSLNIICEPNGTSYVTFPTPAASDSSTKGATTSWVNSRISSIMNNKMQFGQTGSVGYDTSFSVTFPTPFSSTPKVFLEMYNTTSADAIIHHITAVSTTAFTAYNYRSEKNANGTRYAQWLAVV